MKWPGAQMFVMGRLYELWNDLVFLMFLGLCYKW